MANLFQYPCQFIAGAATVESLPEMTHPEIAFAGRSNVGKSSLVNALVGQKALARTSQNPGATKQLNFFLLGDKLMLVDMPGYGFAKVGRNQKNEWERLIRSYLLGRASLKRVNLLVDARRGLLPTDMDYMKAFNDAAVSFQLVLTKSDTLTDKELGILLESVQKIVQKQPAAHPEVIATSSLSKRGIDTLQEELLQFTKGAL